MKLLAVGERHFVFPLAAVAFPKDVMMPLQPRSVAHFGHDGFDARRCFVKEIEQIDRAEVGAKVPQLG